MVAKQEKAGFGSFSSGNVEQMLRDPNWKPPPRPPFLSTMHLPSEVKIRCQCACAAAAELYLPYLRRASRLRASSAMQLEMPTFS